MAVAVDPRPGIKMASNSSRFTSAANAYLPYVSLQPDYAQVYTGVAEGLQSVDRAWLSVYSQNAPHGSIHAKLTLTSPTGGGAVHVQMDEASARQLVLDRSADGPKDLLVRSTLQQSAQSATAPPIISNIVLPSTLLRAPKRTLVTAVKGRLGITAFDVSPTDNSLYVAGGLDGQAHVGSLGGGGEAFAGDDDEDDSVEAKAQRRIRQRQQEAQMAKKTALKGHVGDVRSTRFFPSGQVILTTSSDCTVRVFGIDGANPRTLTGHRRAVLGSAFLDKGKQVLTASLDGTTRLWDIAKDSQITSFPSHQYSGVRAIALVADGQSSAVEPIVGAEANRLAVTGLSSGALEAFDLASRKVAFRVPRSYFPSGDAPLASDSWQQIRSGGIDCIAWSAERNTLLVGTDNGVTMLHDMRMLSSATSATEADADAREPPASLLARWRRNSAAVNDVQFTAQGQKALVATADGTPYCVDLRTAAAAAAATTAGPTVLEEYTGWEIDNVAACRLDARSRVWLAGAEGKLCMY